MRNGVNDALGCTSIFSPARSSGGHLKFLVRGPAHVAQAEQKSDATDAQTRRQRRRRGRRRRRRQRTEDGRRETERGGRRRDPSNRKLLRSRGWIGPASETDDTRVQRPPSRYQVDSPKRGAAVNDWHIKIPQHQPWDTSFGSLPSSCPVHRVQAFPAQPGNRSLLTGRAQLLPWQPKRRS